MKKRIVYFDVLKVITCFMVIMIHVISRNWYVLDLKSNEFTFLTILDSICRCAVPIYLMISGAIFLNEDKNIKIKDIFMAHSHAVTVSPHLLQYQLFLLLPGK